MNSCERFLLRAVILFLAVQGISSPSARAASPPKGTLIQTFNFGANQFELDAIHHRLYASVPSSNSVAVIDTQNLSVLANVFVGSNPFGLGLSEDSSRLYIGNRGSTVNAVTAFDTQLMSVVGNYTLPVSPIDIAVGKDNLVYASPAEAATSHGMMVVNGLTGQFRRAIFMKGAYLRLPQTDPFCLSRNLARRLLAFISSVFPGHPGAWHGAKKPEAMAKIWP